MLSIILVFGCCTQPDNEKTSKKTSTIVNPNGDSELALFMRYMYDDCMRVKTAITEGDTESLAFDPEKMFTAHATEPEKAASETYQQMGKAYMAAHQAFENAKRNDKKAMFTGLVNNCIACHQQLCPGPVRKIKNLHFEH